MRKLNSTLLFLPILMLLLTGCNINGADEPGEVSSETISPQLDVNFGDASSCIDCPGGCIIGFPFNQSIPPQGAYPVRLVTGDCECISQGSGSWSWNVTGSSTTYSGHTGGPGSGSANIVGAAQTLWGFSCGGGGGGGGHTQGGWANWVAEVSHQLQVNPGMPIGTGSWPVEWNVHVQPSPQGGPIRISVPGTEQSDALTSIRVIGDGTNDVIAEFHGTGEPAYELDLSSLPGGYYNVELVFDPGFYLSSSFLKVDPA